jgi:hypothetical protein
MGWLDDIGDAVSSVGDAVGDVVGDAVDAVTGTVGDVVDTVVDATQGALGAANGWLCMHAGSLGCRLGNVILGGASGLLQGGEDIADKALEVVDDLGGAVDDLFHGDGSAALGRIAGAILDGIEGVLDFVRLVTLGTVVGGIRDAWQADDLRTFVDQLVDKQFGEDVDLLGRVRSRIGLNDVSWGLPLKGEHRVFMLDSAITPLWQWHDDGRINLYEMAGLGAGGIDPRRRRTMVRSVSLDGASESSLPVNTWQLSHYLDSKGADGRIRVYALTKDAAADFVRVASDKFKKLGIHLVWNEGEPLDLFGSPSSHTITTLDEVVFDRDRLGQYLVDSGLRAPGGDQCTVLALAAFGFPRGLGQTAGRSIQEGDAGLPCAASPDRTDSCCVTVDSRVGAAVIYHDEWPRNIFRYVLAHECGHYVGLCHFGHDGFENIMYTPAVEAGLHWYSWGLGRYYLNAEPTFTLDDAKNVWRFLVTQLEGCLTDPGPVLV